MLIRCKKKKSRDLPSRKILHPATLTYKEKFFKGSFSWPNFQFSFLYFYTQETWSEKKAELNCF